jgi:hypothetical protein
VRLPAAPQLRRDECDKKDLSKKGGDKPEPKPAATSCGDNDNKHDCLCVGAAEGECAWCAGDFMPPSCVSTQVRLSSTAQARRRGVGVAEIGCGQPGSSPSAP